MAIFDHLSQCNRRSCKCFFHTGHLPSRTGQNYTSYNEDQTDQCQNDNVKMSFERQEVLAAKTIPLAHTVVDPSQEPIILTMSK